MTRELRTCLLTGAIIEGACPCTVPCADRDEEVKLVDQNLYELFRRCILANELDNNLDFAYRFSDPDGVRTGKSGWSFGICQYDINNNPAAILCLRECAFTTDQIAGLKSQTIPIAPLNDKLHTASDVVDKWDDMQLTTCLTGPLEICNSTDIHLENNEAKLHLADYHNQFYMSRGGKMHTFLLGLNRPVSPSDILYFKLNLPWGHKRPDDVNRRYNNIAAICRNPHQCG